MVISILKKAVERGKSTNSVIKKLCWYRKLFVNRDAFLRTREEFRLRISSRAIFLEVQNYLFRDSEDGSQPLSGYILDLKAFPSDSTYLISIQVM